MKKYAVILEQDFRKLHLDIIKRCIETSKKGWGCKFISRETGEELEDMAVIGLFAGDIEDVLNHA